MAVLRTRRELPLPKADLYTSITNLTEAVLLLSRRGQDAVKAFGLLAFALFARFQAYRQPEDVKSSLEYFRFLRICFHPLEAFDIPTSKLTSSLIEALGYNLNLGFVDVTQALEEMATLTHELLASEASGGSRKELRTAILAFASSVATKLNDGNSIQHWLPSEQILQVLREGAEIVPDSHLISLTLARCRGARFQRTHANNEYEDAIAIAEKIVGIHCLADSLTPTHVQEKAIKLITMLVSLRKITHADPVHLEDSIHLIRRLRCIPSPPDQRRTSLDSLLRLLEWQRFGYFGVTGSSGEIPYNLSDYFDGMLSERSRELHQMGRKLDDDPQSLITQRMFDLQKLLASICIGEITDIDAAVECGRALLPSPDDLFSFTGIAAVAFADLLLEAYQRTRGMHHLNEAVAIYRDQVLNVSGIQKFQFMAVHGLLRSLLSRFEMCHCWQDFEEAMQCYAILADHGYMEAFNQFYFSCSWAHCARLHAHPSTSTAYEKAMSLIQKTLLFSPTLQTQHFRLAYMPGGPQGLASNFSSDYASYQIESGQFKQSIETLERGRALLWSEMRGLRASTDQLCRASPALAEKFTAIKQQVESVMTSVAQSERDEICDSRTGTGHHKDLIGRLVTTHRKLLEERDTLISHIQSLQGFEDFLKPLSFDALNSAAAYGPVIIVNQSGWRSDIIILHKGLSPSIISTPSNFYNRANRLKDELLRVRKEKGLDSDDYNLTLTSVLADLYELVGRPVIERLDYLKVRQNSRVWWCPTSAFCSLPLHAMGPIPSDDSDRLYFMDLYISSYTPTLTALIESFKPGLQPETFEKPSLLLVAQPETLFGALGEIEIIQGVRTHVTTLVSKMATPQTVVEGLRDHRFAHFVCHGSLETGKPFDASLELHGDNLTLLEIVRSHLPTAEFAFLSACHTAELTDESIADEGLHLAAAVQFCGFRSVVGTMWAMADTDGADLSQYFYKSMFPGTQDQKGVPYYQRSASALQTAVKKLRRKRGMTLERWVNFVHHGA